MGCELSSVNRDLDRQITQTSCKPTEPLSWNKHKQIPKLYIFNVLRSLVDFAIALLFQFSLCEVFVLTNRQK